MAAADTSSTDAVRHARRRRGRMTPEQAYTLPYLPDPLDSPDRSDPRPMCILTTRFGGKPLRDNDLLQVANFLSKAEIVLIETMKRWSENFQYHMYPESISHAVDRLEGEQDEIRNIFEQLESIKSRDHNFIETYLSDRAILRLYDTAVAFFSTLANDEWIQDNFSVAFTKDLDALEHALQHLQLEVEDAAAEDKLDFDIRAGLRSKWQAYVHILHSVCETFHKPRRLPSWREVMTSIQSPAASYDLSSRATTPNTLSGRSTPNVASQAGSAVSTAVPVVSPRAGLLATLPAVIAQTISSQASSAVASATPKTSMSTNRVSSILWLTLLPAICNIATFAQAYHYSPSQNGVTLPGTTQDSDFWLTLQGSIMQWFVLIVAGIALWKGASSSMWWWIGPTIASLLASALAIPLYLLVSTAWSAAATSIASVLQAFITVQLAMIHY